MRSPGSTHGSSSTLPPIDGGLAFLSAPERIRTLVAGRALRVLTGPRLPGRRFIYSVTARPALKIADSVLGGRLLEDVAEFLLDLSAIYPGVVRQSREVEALFASAAIVAVTTPDPGPIAEVRRVITERIGVTDDPGTVVFNRVLPADWMHAPAGVAGPLASNLTRWATEAGRHDALRRAFASHTGVVPLVIPWLAEAPSTPEGLADLVEATGLVRLRTESAPRSARRSAYSAAWFNCVLGPDPHHRGLLLGLEVRVDRHLPRMVGEDRTQPIHEIRRHRGSANPEAHRMLPGEFGLRQVEGNELEVVAALVDSPLYHEDGVLTDEGSLLRHDPRKHTTSTLASRSSREK